MNEIRYAFEIGQEISFGGIAFKILDRDFDMDGNRHVKKYLCECSNCHDQSWKQEKYLKRCIGKNPNSSGISCRKCKIKYKEKNFVSMAESDPWMIDLLANKEDSKIYSRGSGKKILFKCPTCGDLKKLQISQVARDGKIKCQKCTDGFSYPNKFGLELLEQLPVENLQVEFSCEWTQNKRYDFSFYYNKIHYLLEMDGEMHFNDSFYKDVNIIKKNDELKNKLAAENNCELIRINCIKSEFDFIKSEIQKSKLNDLFDLEKIDWNKIKKNCLKNKILEINDFYNHHKNMTVAEIAAVFNLNYATVLKYLKKCADLKLNDFMTKTEKCKYNKPKILSFYNKGYSIKEISELLDITYAQVNRCIKLENLENAS